MDSKNFSPTALMVFGMVVITGAVGLLSMSKIPVKVSVQKPLSEASGDLGAQITYFGVANADGKVPKPDNVLSDGTLVFRRPVPMGFSVIVEAKPGASKKLPGGKLTVSSGVPDIQVAADQKMGNGSAAVCDKPLGGIPALQLSALGADPIAVNVLREFGCRFTSGAPVTQNAYGNYSYIAPDTRRQYALSVNGALGFPSPSIVTMWAQVRDDAGNIGFMKQLKILVGDVNKLKGSLAVGFGPFSSPLRSVAPGQQTALFGEYIFDTRGSTEDVNVSDLPLVVEKRSAPGGAAPAAFPFGLSNCQVSTGAATLTAAQDVVTPTKSGTYVFHLMGGSVTIPKDFNNAFAVLCDVSPRAMSGDTYLWKIADAPKASGALTNLPISVKVAVPNGQMIQVKTP